MVTYLGWFGVRGRQGLLDSGGEEQLQSPILKAFVLHS